MIIIIALTSILIFAICRQALGAPLISLYIFVCALIFLAGFIFFTRVPHIPMKNNSVTVTDFITNLKKWNEWFPKIKFNGLALMIDMYCVSFFSAALLYIYNDSQPGVGKVPLFGEGTYLVSHDWFFAITNCLTFDQCLFSMPTGRLPDVGNCGRALNASLCRPRKWEAASDR